MNCVPTRHDEPYRVAYRSERLTSLNADSSTGSISIGDARNFCATAVSNARRWSRLTRIRNFLASIIALMRVE